MSRFLSSAIIAAASITTATMVQASLNPSPVVSSVKTKQTVIGQRFTINHGKQVGIFEVISITSKIRLNKVSADGTRLLVGKTFSVAYDEWSTINAVPA